MSEPEPAPRRVALTTEHCWHRVPGGTGKATALLARALAGRGDVDPVGVSAWHRRPPRSEFDPLIPHRRVPLPRAALYELWHRARCPRIERVSRSVAVVHATGGAIPPTSRPLVVTVHDLAWLRYPSMFTSHGLRFFERAHELTVRHADLVLCPSAATRDDCVSNGIEAGRVRVVPWGVSPPTADGHAAAQVRGRFSLGGDFVLAVGTLEPRKNLASLVEAVAALDQPLELVVVGPAGWNDEHENLRRRAGERVRFLGFVDDATLSALYRAATVFCYPSRFEGFGLPVLEAMSHRCAVVTSSGTATAEVVGDAGLQVSPDDVEALSAALERLLVDPAERARLGDAAAARAASYTWEATAEATVAAYREVW